jgi:arylsulfatase A-like enzyme
VVPDFASWDDVPPVTLNAEGYYSYPLPGVWGSNGLATAEVFDPEPVQLRNAGYITAFAGKFGIIIEGLSYNKLQESYDRWGSGLGQTRYETAKNNSMLEYADEYPHSTLSYGAFAGDVIKDAVHKKKPFCLSISFKAPHNPSTPDPRFDDIYKDTKFKKPDNFGQEHGLHLAKQLAPSLQYSRFEGWRGIEHYDRTISIYHQHIYGVDYALGMIRKELDEQGIADNTVIIFTSDNGYFSGSHGLRGKVLPYEESARVPLIVYDPRRETMGKGHRVQPLTGNVDFSPTMMELAGAPIPPGLDGESLVPILDNPQKEIHESLPILNVFGPESIHFLGAVTKDWKYVYWGYEDGKMEAVEELFDTHNDPLELDNQTENPEFNPILSKMRGIYDEQLEHWKRASRDEYAKYGILFDRNAGVEEKK